VSASAPGMEFLLTLDYCIQSEISDQYFESHNTPVTGSQTQSALELLDVIPVFHENPLHWKQIMSALRSTVKFTKRNAPLLATLFSSVFPEYAPIAEGAAKLVGMIP